MAPWTKTLHANCQVNWTNSEVLLAIFMFFFPVIVPPSGQSPCPFSRNHRMSSYIGVLSLVKISNSVHKL